MIAKHKNIGINEIYGILKRDYGYNRHPNSLYRVLKKNNYGGIIKKKTKKHIPKIYNTPLMFGEKMQLDVKYVPAVCCTNKEKYYQYTILDEATRERFIYPYTKRNAYNSVDFLKRAIKYFKYVPKVIQTDNGSEFCNINENDIKEKNHIFDVFLKTNEIIHKRIKIKTPSHNGKVERSHGNDNKRFYKNEKFNSIEDLIIKMSIYLIRSNNIPNSSLGWLTPNEKRTILENKTKTC
ncbi:MAG: DDE-type integrase/transposase/recombinase [Acholeplasmatales bacterium]|nr:DDE-type integrase/transposase/recombinase [Acholeplasmatales bacterium]